jgi:hypothetical protein
MDKIYNLYFRKIIYGTTNEKISSVLVWILTLGAIVGIIVSILYGAKVLGGGGGGSSTPAPTPTLSQAQIDAHKITLEGYKTAFTDLSYDETATSAITSSTIGSLSGFVNNKIAIAREAAVTTEQIKNALTAAISAATKSINSDLDDIKHNTIGGQIEQKYVTVFINNFTISTSA